MSPSRVSTSTELIKRIEDDIRRSGFPLELYVLNVCSKKNTGRMPSIRYDHMGEPRELDLLTTFETIDTEVRGNDILQHTSTDLIIECKKSHEKPWIFFSSRPFADLDVTPFLKYYSEFDSYFSSKNLPSLLTHIFPRITGRFWADVTIPRCVTYHEAFRSKGASEIYKAIDSVITYLTYRREAQVQRRRKVGSFSEFYLPVIVLDGSLFECSMSQDKIDLLRRQHIQLRTFHHEDVYIIDIVTRSYFDRFFNEIQHFHKQLVSAIRSIKFRSAFKAAVNAKWRKRWESPEPWARDMVLMSFASAQKRAKARRK